MRHSALPTEVVAVVAAMPHDAHPMGVLMTGLCALSTMHPEANPALAGQGVYKSREMQDKQIVRLLGKVGEEGLAKTWIVAQAQKPVGYRAVNGALGKCSPYLSTASRLTMAAVVKRQQG
ncbi:Citrate synthase 2, peroxisomal [Tetrabaena socialis]|uniref:Citrate synthase 2, peroxisomal n=1 Tax=Tetrabaena socialis TaxID=47790 RepID=A0A2J8AGK3_9CHLO|nr:Citrate synthase 2, peroxisomal [Tetrabaena socialis]|eukprot:PNH11655.1 Citrate synthase 2, peroxisomal [Tetrabaena socialis]